MSSQNRATLRRKTQSAFSHRRLANEILDSIKDTQEKLNAALDKMDADTDIALDTDYEASTAIEDIFDADAEGEDAQHKASLRKSLRSALSHRKLADEIADSIEEMQTAFNAMLVKMDAEAGTLNDTDYADTLAVEPIDADAEGEDAQHKASFRRSLRSAMSNRKAADEILDSIKETQEAFNAALDLLDAADINGNTAALKVDVINPDAE